MRWLRRAGGRLDAWVEAWERAWQKSDPSLCPFALRRLALAVVSIPFWLVALLAYVYGWALVGIAIFMPPLLLLMGVAYTYRHGGWVAAALASSLIVLVGLLMWQVSVLVKELRRR